MRTVIISVIGISSILIVVMIQTTVNMASIRHEEVTDALATAMSQTMSEVMEQESYGIRNRNEIIAAFLQSMLQKISSDIDLTVKIHQCNYETGKMDVEAIGEYRLPDYRKRSVSVRRQIALTGG